MKHCERIKSSVHCVICGNLVCQSCAASWDQSDGYVAATCETCAQAIDSGSQEQIDMAKARR